MVSIRRSSRAIRNGYCREEFLALEEAKIEGSRRLPPGKR
jgi:hypothetical protein